MTSHCPGWQEEARTGLPQLTSPRSIGPTNPVCLQQEEGQEPQPEGEEVQEDAPVLSPVSVCPVVSCPI